jgi:hypothetical protein
MQTNTNTTTPDYSAADNGRQPGLNSHSHDPEHDLLKRWIVSMDGVPEQRLNSGTYMASRDTEAQAERIMKNLDRLFPGHKWHVFDQFEADKH